MIDGMPDPPEMIELDKVTARFRRITRELDQLRDRADELIIAALRAEVPPTEVTERSPYSPAYVRRLARDNGIPPATRGTKPRRRRATDTS